MNRRRFAAFTLAPAIAIAGIAFTGASLAGSESAAAQPGSEARPSGARAEAARSPRVIALTFYADWCAACKVVEPRLKESLENFSDQPLLTVKLDKTDRDSKQAEYMLAALGLGELWKEHAGKTGYVLLVDAESKRVVDTITRAHDTEAITSKMRRSIRR